MADTLSQKTKSGEGFNTVTTTQDHTALEQWEYGDDIRGSFVLSLDAWMRYVEDIENAYGREDEYYDGNIVYIDTFHKDGIAKQLDKLKKG